MSRFDHLARAGRALHLARESGGDALLVTGATNVRYLSGFTGSNGALALLDGSILLVTDGRYREQAAMEAPEAEVVLDRDALGGAVAALAQRGAEAVVIEGDHMSVSDFRRVIDRYPQLRVLTSSELVESLRRRKEPGEVELIAAACRIASGALDGLLTSIRSGLTERHIARALEQRMVDLGAEAPAFRTIVAGGPNSAIPHHRPEERALVPGDLLKIDAGATWQGYRSDLTRTFVVGAQPSERQRELYEAVAAAAAAARARLRPGVAASTVDAAARDLLTARGFGERFSHGLGHGIGLDIHEAPMLGATATATMDLADVLTVEPGAYLPGFGGVRIEDTLAVTATGADCLTTCSRELVRLG